MLLEPGRESLPVTFEFYDYKRGVPIVLIAVAVTLPVVIVALVKFLLPALLIGDHPPASAIVGSTAIIIVVLYLAHGVSTRTTSALFGTLAGLLLTADLGTLATNWAHLTGIGIEADRILLAVAVETISCWVDGAFWRA